MYMINHRADKVLWFVFFVLMSAYILYEHATSCLAIDLPTMIARHKAFIAGDSEFFNPWQYRILSPYLLEGIIQIFNLLSLTSNEAIPFLVLRFLQNMIIFYAALLYFRALNIQNPYLLFGGLMLLCFAISNSVFQSDLSHNTYFDVIFYLLAGGIILTQNFIWIIPLTLVAALNRETSGFIPFMLIAAAISNRNFELNKKIWVISGISFGLFLLVFVSIRFTFGFRAAEGIHGMKNPMAYLLFNLKFFRMYPHLLGTLGLIPVITLIGFRSLPQILKNWFWLIVPFWFIIHLVKSTAVETRLFLVPLALIFIPALLWLIENYKPDTENHSVKKA
jgi:hypothetical protein